MEEITSKSLMVVLTGYMQDVERNKQMSGEEKKKLVMHLITGYVNNLLIDEYKKQMLLAILPSVIDGICIASKSGFKLNKNRCCLF